VRAGDFIYVSGQVAKDETATCRAATSKRKPAGPSEHPPNLKLDGADLEDVVKVTVVSRRCAQFRRYNKVFGRLLSRTTDFATTVEVVR